MLLHTFARRRLAPILASLVLAACDGLGAGVCEHTYRDPLLVLQNALFPTAEFESKIRSAAGGTAL